MRYYELISRKKIFNSKVIYDVLHVYIIRRRLQRKVEKDKLNRSLSIVVQSRIRAGFETARARSATVTNQV